MWSPRKEQADWIFQIFSKRTEVTTTLVTTNLVPSDWGKIFDSRHRLSDPRPPEPERKVYYL